MFLVYLGYLKLVVEIVQAIANAIDEFNHQ